MENVKQLNINSSMQEIAQALSEHLTNTFKGKPCETWHFDAKNKAREYIRQFAPPATITTGDTGDTHAFNICYNDMLLLLVKIKRVKAQEYRRHYEAQYNYNFFNVIVLDYGTSEPLTTLQDTINHIEKILAEKHERERQQHERIKHLFADVMKQYNLTEYEARRLFEKASHTYTL